MMSEIFDSQNNSYSLKFHDKIQLNDINSFKK